MNKHRGNMMNKKKLFCGILVTVLMTLMVACGDDSIKEMPSFDKFVSGENVIENNDDIGDVFEGMKQERVTKDYYDDGNLERELYYDKEGKLTKKLVYQRNGSLWHETAYEYDEADNIKKEFFYDEEGTLDKYVVYEYDENGNKTKRLKYNGRNDIIIQIEEYGINGNYTKIEAYNVNGNLRVSAEYDEYGNLLEERYYNADGTLREVKNYQNPETDTEPEEEIVEVNKQVAQLYYVDILDGGLMYKITYDIEYNADIVQHTREAIGTSMNSVCSIVRFAGEKVGDRYFYSGIESFDGDLQKEAQRLMNQTSYDSRKILAEGEMTVSGYDGYYYETERIYGEDKYSDYYGVVQIDEGRYFYIYGACLDDIWSRNMTSQEFMEAALISAKFVSREQTDSWK